MPRLLMRSLMAVMMACVFTSEAALAQQGAPDTLAYSVVHLDSSQIRTLPLVRSAEIPSFLNGAVIGLSYTPAFRGQIGAQDIRIDGVPVRNFTFGDSRLWLPTTAVSSVAATLAGASAAQSDQIGIRYNTMRGGTAWQAYARGASDASLPGSIGSIRAEIGAGGPVTKSLRAAVNLSTQSALRSEFNNHNGASLYRIDGIDTTISLEPSPGNVRDVVIPNFVEIDDSEIPASNWDELLGSARIDFAASANTELFVAGHFSRLQEREPFGGGCGTCSMFNLPSQRGARSTSLLFTLGLDQKLSAKSVLEIRVGRGSDEFINGVLASAAEDRSLGIDLSSYEFLVDDDDYPVDDALIQRILTNSPEGRTPFPEYRTDLNPSVEFRMNPYAILSTFATRGVASGKYTYSDESRLYGSASLQSTRGMHRFLIGAEASALEARFADVGYLNSFSTYVWKESPSILSAFVEDAVSLGIVAVQAGLRVDSYDPNTQYAITPGYVVPEAMVDAERETAISPRVAFAVPVRKFTFRGSYGRYADVPSLNEQFLGKNVDFFRFRNTNTNFEFSRPLDLVKITSFHLNGEFRANNELTIQRPHFRTKPTMRQDSGRSRLRIQRIQVPPPS